jgi:hypothetical protein
MRRQEPLKIEVIFSQRIIDDIPNVDSTAGQGQTDDLTTASQRVFEPASNVNLRTPASRLASAP